MNNGAVLVYISKIHDSSKVLFPIRSIGAGKHQCGALVIYQYSTMSRATIVELVRMNEGPYRRQSLIHFPELGSSQSVQLSNHS